MSEERIVRLSDGLIVLYCSIIPPLKKISKTATQMEKMRQWTMKLMKLDMKGSLKPVKKDISKELGGVDVSALP